MKKFGKYVYLDLIYVSHYFGSFDMHIASSIFKNAFCFLFKNRINAEIKNKITKMYE